MALARVLARGQVTLPRDVRRAADIRPGDVVTVRVTAAGRVELKVVPRLSLQEALERYRIDTSVDEGADRAQWQEHAARDVLGG